MQRAASHPPRRAFSSILAVVFALLACEGCATTRADQALHVELQALQARVDELELTNRRLHARLQQHDQTLQLVDDQLRSVRLAVSPHVTGPQPKTIRFSQPPHDPSPNTEQPSPEHISISWNDNAPPPSYTTPHSPADTPIDTEAAQFDEAAEEIIVTDESVRAYIGPHAASQSSQSSQPSQGPQTPRIPKAPVVHGDQLPVMQTDKQGRVLSPPSPPSQDPIQTYRDALDAYRATNYAVAIQGFTAFLSNGPPSDYVDNALYWLGDSYYGLGDYAQAATYFHRVVKEFPNENKVPDALLKVGLTYQRLNKEPAAQEIFQYLTTTYPRSEAARLAREKLSPSDG